MSKVEKSKDAIEITSENVRELFVDNKNLSDFNSQGNPKPVFEVGKKYKLGKSQALPLTNQKNSDGSVKKYGAFEVFQGNTFVGYLSLSNMQARKFVDIRLSKAGKPYAKFDVLNKFGAPEGIVFGIESLLKLAGKEISCKQIIDNNKQPKFGAELEIGMDIEDSDIFENVPLTLLELV